MTKRQLRKQLKEFSHKTEPSTTLYSGALGIYIGGHQYVDVPNRPGFVYVRLRNNTSELIQAHNEVVSPVYGLPVILVRNKTYYEIYGRDSVQYASYWDSSSSYLPKHGHQHEFDPDNNGGGDLVFVHGEQFYPMMTFPSGTDGGNTVLIAPYRYYYSSAWHYAGDTGAGNLLQYGPTGASNAKLLLVGIDATTGNPFVKLGSEFDASITGAAAMTSYVPTNITQSTEIPGAIVRLVTGTSTITWANIYDARQYMGILQAAGASTFLGLTDTPSSYSGQANKLVTVKADASGLEFRTNTGSFGTGGPFTSTGTTYFNGLQYTFYPTSYVSDYTGSAYLLGKAPSGGAAVLTSTLSPGNDQLAYTFVTPLGFDFKEFLLLGNPKLRLGIGAQFQTPTGTHSMSTYAKLFIYDGSTYIDETLIALSPLAINNWTGDTEINGAMLYTFSFTDDPTNLFKSGDIQIDPTNTRLIVKVYLNVSVPGLDGYVYYYANEGNYFLLNLEQRVLNNDYLSITGSFLDLRDTPSSYAGQGSKFVAVNSGATALEFVTAPAGGGGGSGLVVYDDSVYKVTGTAISFDDNLSVAVTGSVAYVSVGAGALLGYNLGISGSYSTTSATMADVDATNMAVTFIAKSTINVLVRLTASNQAGVTNISDVLWWGLREGSTTIAGPQVTARGRIDAGTNLIFPASCAFVIKNVSAGSHTYKWAYTQSAGTGSIGATPASPAVMEVWLLP